MTENQTLHVVAAIIIQDSKVLACRRAGHKAAAGLWEFPGGKVELGENPHEALVREIKEELGLECQVIGVYDISDTAVGTQVIRLETILCRIADLEEIRSSDHDQFSWVSAAEATGLHWAEPDLPALKRLVDEGII